MVLPDDAAARKGTSFLGGVKAAWGRARDFCAFGGERLLCVSGSASDVRVPWVGSEGSRRVGCVRVRVCIAFGHSSSGGLVTVCANANKHGAVEWLRILRLAGSRRSHRAMRLVRRRRLDHAAGKRASRWVKHARA